MEGCCLALITDCRLYSSHCYQCCLGPVPAGWNVCCCRCTVELAEGSICQLEHRSCISMNSLLWRWAVPLHAHSLKGTRCRACLASVHSLDITLHIIWPIGVPQNVSTVHCLTCLPWTCDAVSMGCVVGPAGVDTKQHIWLDKMLHDTAVSAVCHWTCSSLDVMQSRAVLVDSLGETLCMCLSWDCHCYHVFCVIELTGKDKWSYHFGHALTHLLRGLAQGAIYDAVRCWSSWKAMDAFLRAMCHCTHWENMHLPHLCCAPLDLLKGHAMRYNGGPVSIANTAIMDMQWRSCCSPPHRYVIGLS